MIPTYATPADLAQHPEIDNAPTNAAALLARAGRLVYQATVTALYDADPVTKLPTDVDKREALRDACCSQVATWLTLTVDPAAGAADAGRTIAAKSFGSGSVQYVNYASTVEARARAATRLSDDALLILRAAGLTVDQPQVLG